jgi:hypothetical protein
MIDTPTSSSTAPRFGHLLNVILFVAILTFGGVYSLFARKKKISAEENRTLAEFPQYSDSTFWNGEYFRSLELFYADHFPFRDQWIDVSTRFRDGLGFQSSEIKMYNDNPMAGAESAPDTIPSANNQYRPEEGAVGEIKKGVFVFKNRAFERFGGGPEMGRSYASTVNGFTKLGLPSLQVYNLVIPVALEFELTEKYSKLQKPNRPAIENIYNSLDPSIKRVWAIDELRKHRDEYIYFNTDHHWTSLGAYYAYRAFCAAAGFMPVQLDTIPSRIRPAFLGSLFRLTRDPQLKSNPDSVRYYLFRDSVRFSVGSNIQLGSWIPSKMYAEGVRDGNSYSVFLQGDLPVVKMETQQKNGRRIAIIKESYGNAFAPFLINHYEKVIVVDQRYYTGDFIEMLKREGIGELLVINNIFAAHTPFHIDKIKGLQQPLKKGTDAKKN